MSFLRRLYNRLFVCPKWGHRPGPPPRGGRNGYLSEHCFVCGTYLYKRRKWA
jgi:hypothetical protein